MELPAGTIVVIKLKTNMELVGEMLIDNDEYIGIKQPLQIIFKQIPGLLYPLLTLKDYMVLAPDNALISFPKRDLAVLPVIARAPFAKFYELNVKTASSLSQFIDNACTAFVKSETPLTPEELVEAKQHRFQSMLEQFDTRYERKH